MLALALPLWANNAALPLPFAGFASPTDVSAYGSGVGAGTVVTGAVTCTPSSGTPDYTYSWIQVDGDTEIHATSPTSATTTFRASTPPFIFSYTATFVCQVTDSLANVVNSNLVTVNIERNT